MNKIPKYIVTYTINEEAKEQQFYGEWETKIFLKGLSALGGSRITIYKITEVEISLQDLG